MQILTMPAIVEHISEVFLNTDILHQQVATNLGLLCLIMLFVAAWLWVFFGRSTAGYKITSVYWLGCGLCLWLAGYLLPVRLVLPIVMAGLSTVSLGFVLAVTFRAKYRWLRSWPENLQHLHHRARIPPALASSLIAVAVFVLFMGLCYLTTWFTCILVTLQAIALLVAAGIEYRDELAIVGMSLLSLAVISALLVVTIGKGAAVPSMLNVMLFALACLAFFWVWLSRVWLQQIINGQPLTTAARMIGIATHMGIILLGTATLVAIKLALWPKMPGVADWDSSSTRLIAGSLAIGLLIMVAAWIARKLDRVNLGLLAVMNLVCLIALNVIRIEDWLSSGFVPHWPLWVIGFSALLGLIAMASPADRKCPVAEAAKRTALLICPGILLIAVFKGPDNWQMTSIAALAGIYATAGIIRLSRRQRYLTAGSAGK